MTLCLTCGFFLFYRHWSFAAQVWTELPGEMIYPHFVGAAVLAGGNLYAFCGRSVREDLPTAVGTRDAEVYDFKTGVWSDLPKTPPDYSVDGLIALALSATKIILVGGRYPKIAYAKMSYMYDTETKEYTHMGERNTVDHRGTGNMGCAVLPGGMRVLCAGGMNDWVGDIARYLQFYIHGNWT